MFSKWRERLRQTLGFRLAWWYAVVFLVSSLALVLLTYFLLAATLRRHDRETVQTTLVQFAAAYVRGGGDALAREIQRAQIAGVEGPLFVRTVSRRQDVLFLSAPERWREFDLSQLSAPEFSGEESWATLETGGDPSEELEVLSVRLADGTLFQVGKGSGHRAELLRRFRQVLLFDLALIVVTGLIGGAMLTSSALQPVRALADTVTAIMRTGRTNARVPVQPQRDVLGDLAVLLNAMLDRIDAVVGGMRGALDNVAHDLRTPMARFRGIAENALASGDTPALRQALEEALEESDRIIAMLNTLMDISEAETGTMALRLERTSIGELIAQTVDLYEDLAEDAGVRIQVDVPGTLEADLDRSRFRQVLANLVDNAVKYTRPGGLVQISASAHGDHVVIAVADTGSGIPEEELPHVWTRLYRGDKSRSTRGLGLGLSLVKAIVEAHRGSASITSTVGVGTRVELRIPATDATFHTCNLPDISP